MFECGLHAGDVIGPDFFRNEQGVAKWFCTLLTDFFPNFYRLNIHDIWLQKDAYLVTTSFLEVVLFTGPLIHAIYRLWINFYGTILNYCFMPRNQQFLKP